MGFFSGKMMWVVYNNDIFLSTSEYQQVTNDSVLILSLSNYRREIKLLMERSWVMLKIV